MKKRESQFNQLLINIHYHPYKVNHNNLKIIKVILIKTIKI